MGLTIGFIDDEFGRMYENEKKWLPSPKTFRGWQFLSPVWDCTDSLLSCRNNAPKIGVRKTMGASNSQILYSLLSVLASY